MTSAEDPFELLERMLASLVRLLRLAEGMPDSVGLERMWWSLRGMKRGAEAALAGEAKRRRLTPAGRTMLLTNCKAERAAVYRCAARLGLVPDIGRPASAPESDAPDASAPGQAVDTLLGL